MTIWRLKWEFSQWRVLNSWTSRFQNFENINFYCLSHPVWYSVMAAQADKDPKQNSIFFLFPSYILLPIICQTFLPCGDMFLTFPTNTFATPSQSPLYHHCEWCSDVGVTYFCISSVDRSFVPHIHRFSWMSHRYFAQNLLLIFFFLILFLLDSLSLQQIVSVT